MRLNVVLHPEEEGGYSVLIPALPGCFTEGDTLEEAMANAREAAAGMLDVLRDLRPGQSRDLAAADIVRDLAVGDVVRELDL